MPTNDASASPSSGPISPQGPSVVDNPNDPVLAKPVGPAIVRIRVSSDRVLDFAVDPAAAHVEVDLTGERIDQLLAVSTDAQGLSMAAGAGVKILPRTTSRLTPDVQMQLAVAIHTIDLDRADQLEAVATQFNCLPLLVEEINALRDPGRLAHRTLQASGLF